MSLQIDPNSVHLGKNAGVVDNIYIASYVGATGATGSCVLPPEIPYTPGNSSLIPLQPSCTFNFTDVLEIPPIPTPPPPASFRGCETLSASVNLITTEATKKTSLSLVAGGPFPGDTGTNDCTLKLVGIVDIDACTNFTATSVVNFNNAAAGSFLTIIPKSIPDCGFDLRGSININACENFTATSNITFNNALRGSYLTLTPSSLPNCGLDISGNLDVNACETFSATSSVSFRGNAVKKSSFSVSPASTPNCGFTLNGDVVIDACTDFSASGGINFSGKAVKSSSVTVTAAQQPNCGLVLSGNVEIDACATFTAISNLKIYGQSVSTITPLSIVSIGTPDCGFILNGELSIDACPSTSIEIVPDNLYPSYITLYTNVPAGQPPSSGEVFSYSPLILRSRPLTQGSCDSVVAMSIDPIDLELPSSCCPIIAPYTPGTMTGCCWDEDANGPFLYKDEYTNELYIGGTLPTPCFVCDTTITATGTMPFVYSDLTLNSLSVNFLTGTNCCTSHTDNVINLCSGIIQLTNPGDGTQLYANSTVVQVLAGGQGVTQIKAADIYLADGWRRSELDSGSLTLENTYLGNTYMYADAQSIYYTNADGAENVITANNIKTYNYGGDVATAGILGSGQVGFSAGATASAFSSMTPYGFYVDQGVDNDARTFIDSTKVQVVFSSQEFSELSSSKLIIQSAVSAKLATMDSAGYTVATANVPNGYPWSAIRTDGFSAHDGTSYSSFKANILTVGTSTLDTTQLKVGTSTLDTTQLKVANGATLSGTTLTIGTNTTLTAAQLTVGGSTGGRLTNTTLSLGNASLTSGSVLSNGGATFSFASPATGTFTLRAVSVCVSGATKTGYVFGNW